MRCGCPVEESGLLRAYLREPDFYRDRNTMWHRLAQDRGSNYCGTKPLQAERFRPRYAYVVEDTKKKKTSKNKKKKQSSSRRASLPSRKSVADQSRMMRRALSPQPRRAINHHDYLIQPVPSLICLPEDYGGNGFRASNSFPDQDREHHNPTDRDHRHQDRDFEKPYHEDPREPNRRNSSEHQRRNVAARIHRNEHYTQRKHSPRRNSQGAICNSPCYATDVDPRCFPRTGGHFRSGYRNSVSAGLSPGQIEMIERTKRQMRERESFFRTGAIPKKTGPYHPPKNGKMRSVLSQEQLDLIDRVRREHWDHNDHYVRSHLIEETPPLPPPPSCLVNRKLESSRYTLQQQSQYTTSQQTHFSTRSDIPAPRVGTVRAHDISGTRSPENGYFNSPRSGSPREAFSPGSPRHHPNSPIAYTLQERRTHTRHEAPQASPVSVVSVSREYSLEEEHEEAVCATPTSIGSYNSQRQSHAIKTPAPLINYLGSQRPGASPVALRVEVPSGPLNSPFATEAGPDSNTSSEQEPYMAQASPASPRSYVSQREVPCSPVVVVETEKFDLCQVCGQHPIQCSADPCGHASACFSCGETMKDCPICGATVKKVRR